MSKAPVQTQERALIEQEVARGMAPYRRLGFPPDVLDEMEHLLRFALENHPTAQHLLRRLCDDPVMMKSDGVDTSGLEEAQKKERGRDVDREMTGVPPTLSPEQHKLWASEPDVARRAVDAVVAELGPSVPDEAMLSVAVDGTLEAAVTFDRGRGVTFGQWAFFYAANRVWEKLREAHRGDKAMLARIHPAMLRFMAYHHRIFDVWRDTRETDRAALTSFTDGILFSGAMAVSASGIAARGEPDVVEAEWSRRAGDALRKVMGELRPEQFRLLERCAAYGEPVKHVAQEANKRYNTVLDELHELEALCGARLAGMGIKDMPPWNPVLSGEVFDGPSEPANDGRRAG